MVSRLTAIIHIMDQWLRVGRQPHIISDYRSGTFGMFKAMALGGYSSQGNKPPYADN